jgi:hypothetical protein
MLRVCVLGADQAVTGHEQTFKADPREQPRYLRESLLTFADYLAASDSEAVREAGWKLRDLLRHEYYPGEFENE